jgi:hypothetical protein
VAPTPDEQIRFLVNLQRLLDEGLFVASYKFALLLSLVDLFVEKVEPSGPCGTGGLIKIRHIGKKLGAAISGRLACRKRWLLPHTYSLNRCTHPTGIPPEARFPYKTDLNNLALRRE